MERKLIKIYVRASGVPERKRKERQLILPVGEIDTIEELTPEKVIDLERKAWEYIEGAFKNYKKTATMQFNNARESGEMIFVDLIPFKVIRLLK